MGFFRRHRKGLIIGGLLTPPLLLLLLVVLLYLPPVQSWAVALLERKASEATKMEISIGKLRLGFPLSLHLQDVEAIRSEGDTLARLGELRVDISLIPLFCKRVEVNGLGISAAYLNFSDSAGLLKIRASVGELQTGPISADLDLQKADLGRWLIRDTNFYLFSADTVADTTKKATPPKWVLSLNSLDIDRISARIELPHNNVYTSAFIESGTISNVEGLLERNRYSVGRAKLHQARGTYDRDLSAPAQEGVMDYGHIAVHDLNVDVRDLVSEKSFLRLDLLSASVRERSGLEIENLEAKYRMDSTGLSARDINLRTAYSRIEGRFKMPFATFEAGRNINSNLELKAKLALADLGYSTGIVLRPGFKKVGQPLITEEDKRPISIEVKGKGGMDQLQIDKLKVDWANYLSLQGKGRLLDLSDNTKRRGNIGFDLTTGERAQHLLSLASEETRHRYRLPAGTVLRGKLTAKGSRYDADVTLNDHSHGLEMRGYYDIVKHRYDLSLKTKDLDLMRYMPHDSIGVLDATIQLAGRGIDPYHQSTTAELSARINQVNYAAYRADSIRLSAKLQHNALTASFASPNKEMSFEGNLDMLLKRDKIEGSMQLDLDTINLYAMRLTNSPLALSSHLDAHFSSNLKSSHLLSATIRDINVSIGDDHLTPGEILLLADTRADSIVAEVASGDLKVNLNIHQTLDNFLATTKALSKFVQKEIEKATLGSPSHSASISDLYSLLPDASLIITMGQGNPLRDYLHYQGIHYRSAEAAIYTGGRARLEAIVDITGFQQDTTRIDKLLLLVGKGTNSAYFSANESPRYLPQIRLAEQDSATVTDFLDFRFLVKKQPYRAQKAFELHGAGRSSLDALTLKAQMLDRNHRPLHQLGLRAFIDNGGYGLHIDPYKEELILQGYPLSVNSDNILYLYKGANRVRANLELKTSDNTALRLLSNDSDNGEQEIRLGIERLRLAMLHFLPGMNTLDGVAFADLRIQTKDLSVSSLIGTGDVSINHLTFEGREVGDLAMAMFYQPKNKQSHYLTADFSYNGNTALRLDGIFETSAKKPSIEAEVNFIEFPLNVANPILGAGTARLFGALNGKLRVQGATEKPSISGEIALHEAGAHASQVGATLYSDNSALRIDQSTIYFDNYKFYTDRSKKNSLNVDGYFRLFGKPDMYTDLRVNADNLQIVNSKEAKDGDLIYGKFFMSTDLSLKGPVDQLKIRGNVGVLGNTNCTYVYSDSPLKPKDRMAGVVEFVDFSDSLYKVKTEMPELELGRLDILLNIHIDPAVQVGVDLSAGHSDYVQLTGGGDLTFSYPPYGEMSLIGRYEMSGGGTARYSFPVIGAKVFSVDRSSYVSWSGKVDNPYINFQAMQRVRADIAEEGQDHSRKVNFDVGIVVQESLDKLKLRFDLSAPEDLNLQSSIKAMSPEERGKLAVGLMATGIYLANSGGNSNFTFDNALSALIQSELSSVTNKILEGSDLSVGMESSDGTPMSKGNNDITYSFSKRFFNDRVRLMVGGKVQTGANAAYRERSFIDNVALEYRLDQAGSHYLSLLHHRNSDNMFEGEITETSLSYLIRRKLMYLRDLFVLRPSKKEQKEKTSKTQPQTAK